MGTARNRSLERPRTLLADASHSISPYVRQRFEEKRLKACIEQGPLHSIIIPYGDQYGRMHSVVKALEDYVWRVGPNVTIDLNRVMRAGILSRKPDIALCVEHAGGCLALPISRIANLAEPCNPDCIVRDVPEPDARPTESESESENENETRSQGGPARCISPTVSSDSAAESDSNHTRRDAP